MEIDEIMEKWASKDASLTLYIERKSNLGLGLGAEDYWAFVARYEKGEEADVTAVLESLICHGYKAVADRDSFVGTVAVFLS